MHLRKVLVVAFEVHFSFQIEPLAEVLVQLVDRRVFVGLDEFGQVVAGVDLRFVNPVVLLQKETGLVGGARLVVFELLE